MSAAILLLTLLALAGQAEASGRAACRADFGAPQIRVLCYAEQVVWRLGPVEADAGVEWDSPAQVTPYTAIAYYGRKYWVVLELGKSVTTADWAYSLAGGVRW